jgi:hypothetical protein
MRGGRCQPPGVLATRGARRPPASSSGARHCLSRRNERRARVPDSAKAQRASARRRVLAACGAAPTGGPPAGACQHVVVAARGFEALTTSKMCAFRRCRWRRAGTRALKSLSAAGFGGRRPVASRNGTRFHPVARADQPGDAQGCPGWFMMCGCAPGRMAARLPQSGAHDLTTSGRSRSRPRPPVDRARRLGLRRCGRCTSAARMPIACCRRGGTRARARRDRRQVVADGGVGVAAVHHVPSARWTRSPQSLPPASLNGVMRRRAPELAGERARSSRARVQPPHVESRRTSAPAAGAEVRVPRRRARPSAWRVVPEVERASDPAGRGGTG